MHAHGGTNSYLLAAPYKVIEVCYTPLFEPLTLYLVLIRPLFTLIPVLIK
jgi:hypothetical protein